MALDEVYNPDDGSLLFAKTLVPQRWSTYKDHFELLITLCLTPSQCLNFFAKMYTLKSLATFALILFASIVTASVSVRLHVDSGQQDVLEAVPQQNDHTLSLDWRDCSDYRLFRLSGVSVNPDPPAR